VTIEPSAAPGNRIEAWLRHRRSNALILIAGLALLWLLLDSFAALGLTAAGFEPSDRFFIMRWVQTSRILTAEAREIVSIRGPSHAGYMDRFQADGLLGHRLVPNFLTTTPPPWGGWVLPSFWFMTNAQGFPPVERGAAALRSYAIPKPHGTFRMVILGGSTVEGNGVNTPFDSLPAKLAARLQQAFDAAPHPGFDRVELINAGVSNYASDQEYLHLLADILPLQPDLVLVYDGWNDAEVLPGAVAGGSDTRYYRPQSQADNAARANASVTVSGALRNVVAVGSGRFLDETDGFATFYSIHKALNVLIKRIRLLARSAQPGTENVFDAAASIAAANLFEQNRERMVFLARQQGFRLASILQPIMTVDGKTYSSAEQAALNGLSPLQRREREAFYRAVRPHLADPEQTETARGKICFRDLSTESFADHPEQVYSDTGHLNAVGNQIMAAKILATLQSCGVLWSSPD